MRIRHYLLPWIIALVVPAVAQAIVPAVQQRDNAGTQTFTSDSKQTTLLELFTAEGCSSCPPADAWLGDYVDDHKLWKRIVPVAFHVTYWDQYGWPDRYATAEYTQRQRDYAANWHNGEAYTPNFVRNGRDWQLWFRHPRPSPVEPASVEADSGVLAIARRGQSIAARYTPVAGMNKPPELHVAVLAFGLSTAVRAGENVGRRLDHDFVVIGYSHQPLAGHGSRYTANLTLPQTLDVPATRYALAAWVAERGDMHTLQATGGWLDAAP